jgi:hypothetical protein
MFKHQKTFPYLIASRYKSYEKFELQFLNSEQATPFFVTTQITYEAEISFNWHYWLLTYE